MIFLQLFCAVLVTFEYLGRDSEYSEQKARGLSEESLATSPAERFCLSTKKRHQEMSLMSQGL